MKEIILGLIFLSAFGFCGFIAYANEKYDEESIKEQKLLILKMKQENCVETGFIQKDKFIRQNQFIYTCDNGISYTVNFKIIEDSKNENYKK